MMLYKNKIKDIDALNQQIDQFRPISQDVLKQLREYYRIGLTYTSNAIEGNTLTETETKVVLEDGLTIAGKPLKYVVVNILINVMYYKSMILEIRFNS